MVLSCDGSLRVSLLTTQQTFKLQNPQQSPRFLIQAKNYIIYKIYLISSQIIHLLDMKFP